MGKYMKTRKDLLKQFFTFDSGLIKNFITDEDGVITSSSADSDIQSILSDIPEEMFIAEAETLGIDPFSIDREKLAGIILNKMKDNA